MLKYYQAIRNILAIFEKHMNDIKLDIPFNSHHKTYTTTHDHKPGYDHLHRSDILTDFFNKSNDNANIQNYKFSDIYFYDLLESDKQKSDDIYSKLCKRGLEKIIINIIKSSKINDGNFLLEEKTLIFFEKLFKEILSESLNDNDEEKLTFFQNILNEYNFKKGNYMEDVFEGLNLCYKELKTFMIKNKISESYQKDLFDKAVIVIKKQMNNRYNFKIVLERFINILKYVVSQGGNVGEQLKYLSSDNGSSILSNSDKYWIAQKLGLNVIHVEAKLERNSDIHDADFYQKNKLMSVIYEATFTEYERFSVYNSLKYIIRYLLTIPSNLSIL